MPKKRIDHKGKPKHSTEQSEDYPFRKNSDDSEEEYTTVVDYETNKKYSKRLIEKNWSKYEASSSDFKLENEDDDLFKTDDFNYLLKTASSDCSHFEFNSEKLWKSKQNSLPPSNIFSLDIDILSKGLACVPFYELMGLNESELTSEDKLRFDEEARKGWKEYVSIKEKTNISDKAEVKTLESDLQILEIKEDSGGKENEKINESAEVSTEGIENESCGVERSRKMFFSENEENLEDWLDSVLDD